MFFAANRAHCIQQSVHMSFLKSIFGAAKPPEENRSNPRIQTGCRVMISWVDERGRRHSAHGRVLDMNDNGALVKTGASISLGSQVYFQSVELGLMGSARVRHSDPCVLSYKLGLQFAGPLSHKY
jgi:hypothetical protein